MLNEWICLYCNTKNTLDVKFCKSCSACFMDIHRQYIHAHSAEILADSEEQSENNHEGITDISEQLLKPGDLISGLFRLTEAVREKDLPLSRFSEGLAVIAQNTDIVFTDIINNLLTIPETAPEYQQMLQEQVMNLRFQFQISLEELARYADKSEIQHLFNGLKQAQRAELDFIDLLKMLRTDARANQFSEETDVFGKLACSVIEGSLEISDFKNRVNSFSQNIIMNITEARILVKQANQKVASYESNREDLLESAYDNYKQAADLLAGAILNLHDPEDTRQAVREIIEEVVETMEEEPPQE